MFSSNTQHSNSSQKCRDLIISTFRSQTHRYVTLMFPSICVRRWLSLGAQSGATLSPFSDQGAPKAHQRRLRTLTDVTKFGFQTQGQIESVSGGGPGRSLGWVLRGSSGVFFFGFFFSDRSYAGDQRNSKGYARHFCGDGESCWARKSMVR